MNIYSFTESKADKDKGTNVKVANPGPYFGFGISGIGQGL